MEHITPYIPWPYGPSTTLGYQYNTSMLPIRYRYYLGTDALAVHKTTRLPGYAGLPEYGYQYFNNTLNALPENS